MQIPPLLLFLHPGVLFENFMIFQEVVVEVFVGCAIEEVEDGFCCFGGEGGVYVGGGVRRARRVETRERKRRRYQDRWGVVGEVVVGEVGVLDWRLW